MQRTAQTIKSGIKIETIGFAACGGFAPVAPEPATICRWTKVNGDVPNHVNGRPGWHIVRFADGGKLCMHESRFRVVDNRRPAPIDHSARRANTSDEHLVAVMQEG